MEHAVRHEVVCGDAEHAQTPDTDGTCRSAVAVVVGDDGDGLMPLSSECKPFGCFTRTFEHGGRQHAGPFLL